MIPAANAGDPDAETLARIGRCHVLGSYTLNLLALPTILHTGVRCATDDVKEMAKIVYIRESNPLDNVISNHSILTTSLKSNKSSLPTLHYHFQNTV